MSKDFFPQRPDSRPTIYAYEDTNPQYKGLLKVGYTTVDVQTRVCNSTLQFAPANRHIELFSKNPQCGMTEGHSPIVRFTNI